MKAIVLIVVMLLSFGCVNRGKHVHNKNHNNDDTATETLETSTNKVLSPHTFTSTTVGDTQIYIDYSSPGVRNRIIFGGLLPYNEVWQAGAHKATWVETNKDLTIAGKKLSAGKYGFFVIPTQDEWTIIFNTNWQQHGKDEYDEKDDELRFKVHPVISDHVLEHLEYRVVKISENEGTFSLLWEKAIVNFTFRVNQ